MFDEFLAAGIAALFGLVVGLILFYVRKGSLHLRHVVPVLAIAAALGFVVWAVWPHSPAVAITSPESGEVVAPGAVVVEGTAAHLPDDAAVRVAVYHEDGRRFYPVAELPELKDDGTWRVTVELDPGDGARADFQLVALTVDETGATAIDHYLTESEAAQSWPGLDELPAGVTDHDWVAITSVKPVPSTSTTTRAVVEDGTGTPDDETGTSTTQPPPHRTLAAPIEAESGSGDGRVMIRTAASGDHTVLLLPSSSHNMEVAVPYEGRYDIVVRYSNDNTGPLETVTLSVDGVSVAEFAAEDTGDDGAGWNHFALSPLFEADLTTGSHILTVGVTGGDGYGVEIDAIASDWPQTLDASDQEDTIPPITIETTAPPPPETVTPSTDPITTASATTPPTSATTTTTSLAPPKPLVVEVETGTGDGELMPRSNASGLATVNIGDAWQVEFDLGEPLLSAIHIRYSNDNFGETEQVEVAVDNQVLGEFTAEDTGDYGSGWNNFVWSPQYLVDLDAGTHTMVFTVTGGDSYSIELDVIADIEADVFD